MYIHNFFHVPPRKVTIEFFPTCDKKICNYNKRGWTCHPATSCVRDQDATTAPASDNNSCFGDLLDSLNSLNSSSIREKLHCTGDSRSWNSEPHLYKCLYSFLYNIEVYEEQVHQPKVIHHHRVRRIKLHTKVRTD